MVLDEVKISYTPYQKHNPYKNNKLDFNKIKNVCTSKDIVKTMDRLGENIFKKRVKYTTYIQNTKRTLKTQQ